MDDESGESMEEEVPVIGAGELESWRLVCGWRREAGSWFQNDIYFCLIVKVRSQHELNLIGVRKLQCEQPH